MRVNPLLTEPILDYVRRRLEEFKGQWRVIHLETGVEYDTIAKIARGERPNPELKNLQPLIDWFLARDALAEKVRKSASA